MGEQNRTQVKESGIGMILPKKIIIINN